MSRPLVCVHGLAGSARWWRPVLPALAARYDVHLLDLRRVAPDDGADWLASALADARVERPILLGHSLGGLLCAQLASRLPRDAQPAKLVLADPAGIPTGRRLATEALALAATLPTLAPAFLPTLALDALRWGPRSILRGGLYAVRCDLRVDLARIAAPTLLLWGARDPLVPVRLAATWRDAIPGARVEVVPRAGHVPMFENPSAFLRAVLGFLEKPADEPGDDVRV